MKYEIKAVYMMMFHKNTKDPIHHICVQRDYCEECMRIIYHFWQKPIMSFDDLATNVFNNAKIFITEHKNNIKTKD